MLSIKNLKVFLFRGTLPPNEYIKRQFIKYYLVIVPLRLAAPLLKEIGNEQKQ